MNGFTIKCIAVISMLIDHIGYVLFPQHMWLRMIGRIAFPIYCFLLVEGYHNTRNVKKYLLRLGIFALLSEIPFDLAFNHSLVYVRYNNVFITLFLGLLAVWTCDLVKEKAGKFGFLGIGTFVIAAIAAELLYTDYAAWGIALIFVFYYMYKGNKIVMFIWTGIILGCMTWLELFGLIAFIPIFLYNDKRGPNHKALSIGFYAFYPVHLLVLYGILCLTHGIWFNWFMM